MNAKARAYVSIVTVAGLSLVASSPSATPTPLVDRASWGLWVLFAAVIVGELLPIRLGPDRGEVAPSTTFTFAVLLHTGLAAAVLAQATASVLADILTASARRAARSTSRSTASRSSAAGAALHLTGVLPHHDTLRPGDVPAILLGGAVFFVVNTGLVATAVSLVSETRLRDSLSRDLINQSATEGILLGLAPLAVLALDFAPVLLAAARAAAVRGAPRRAPGAHRRGPGAARRADRAAQPRLFHDRTRAAIAHGRAATAAPVDR